MLNAGVGIQFGTQNPSIYTMRMNSDSNHASQIIMSDTNGNIGKIIYDPEYNTMRFLTNSTERMFLSDVGLSCTNLTVDNNLITDNIKYAGTNINFNDVNDNQIMSYDANGIYCNQKLVLDILKGNSVIDFYMGHLK